METAQAMASARPMGRVIAVNFSETRKLFWKSGSLSKERKLFRPLKWSYTFSTSSGPPCLQDSSRAWPVGRGRLGDGVLDQVEHGQHPAILRKGRVMAHRVDVGAVDGRLPALQGGQIRPSRIGGTESPHDDVGRRLRVPSAAQEADAVAPEHLARATAHAALRHRGKGRRIGTEQLLDPAGARVLADVEIHEAGRP